MNQSQQQAIDRVFEILSEHFDHVVIAVGTYDEDKQYTSGVRTKKTTTKRAGFPARGLGGECPGLRTFPIHL